ncbi:MAG: hypothetical protein V4850_29665 [Myxococcota bacterium]
MRDLLDRLGCVIQLGVGVGAFALLVTCTALPLWASVGIAGVASFVGTWLLVAVVGGVLDALG